MTTNRSGRQRQPEDLKSPDPPKVGTDTRMSVYKHPVHPMLVTFPIAFLVAAVGSDLLFWYEEDPFWARMSLWLVGGGTFMGILAGIAGTIELFLVHEIRRRSVAWSHFVAAVMLLSVGFANWTYRVDDPIGAVLPWGLYLSLLGAALVGIAGWLGGHLVFEHHFGVGESPQD